MKPAFVKLLSLSLLIFAMLSSSSCSREPDRALVISKLKNSAKLATVEYIVTKVISAKDKNWFAKDAYFFAETEATIKAGIDLEKLKEDDVKITGKRISITLPPVEIINFSYPAEGFKVIEKYSDQESIFKWNSIDVKEKDNLYRQGEADIRENIDDLGIIKTAQTNTRTLITKILAFSGFEEIYIEFKDSKDGLATQDKQLLKDLKEFFSKNKN
jgi:hypothetical protein